MLSVEPLEMPAIDATLIVTEPCVPPPVKIVDVVLATVATTGTTVQ